METLDRSKVRYVYDVTMMVNPNKGVAPTITNALMGRRMSADAYIRSFETKDLPVDAESASEFLVKLHQEKDQLIDSYKKYGSFTQGLPEDLKDKLPAYKPTRARQNLAPVFCTLALNALVFPPIVYQLVAMALSGSATQLVLVSLIVPASLLVLKKFIGLTKIDSTPKKHDW